MTASLEDIKTFDVEEWLTLNTAASPTKLKLGQTPDAKNVWVDEKPGSVITANGFIKVGTNPSGNPTTFCIDYFKASTGSQTFVCSDNSTVWTTTDFQTFTSIVTGLSSSFQLRGMVIRDKLWLTNGSDSVRTYDGSSVVALDGSGSTPNVPKGRYISYHDERVWLLHTSSNRSGVNFTALTDSGGTIIAPDNASAWPSDNLLQVSEGDADFGTGMYLYRGYLHFFKQYSIWRLVGYDEYTYSKVKTRASTGTRFNESLQELDGLIHLVGTDGIYVFDGETTERISDIIDPAAASQTAFGFGQLQQPNANNQFWETTLTTEWNLGTVSRNLTVDDSITVAPADDNQADFAAGTTLTNIDASSIPGQIQLTISNSGTSATNVGAGQNATLQANHNTGIIGSAALLTDGNTTNAAGFSGSPSAAGGSFIIPLPNDRNITTITLKSVVCGVNNLQFLDNGVVMTPSSVTGGGIIAGTLVSFPASASPTDYTIVFPAFTTTSLEVRIEFVANTSFTVTEVQVFLAAYNSTGKFVSRTLDLGTTPASAGYLRGSFTHVAGDGCTTSFFTQTSADGISWDAEVTIPGVNTDGYGLITSTARRYIRWGVNFTSTGSFTQAVDLVNLPATFISPIHDTGGSIFAWGPFESDYAQGGLPIAFYYRTATTSLGIAAATWNLIVPGAVISDSVNNRYVQFKIEFSGAITTAVANNVTINWIVGTGTQPQTQQGIASAVWRNRYWMSAASSGAAQNDTILIRGKKTFQSPWQLKDWQIISFATFQNNFYGGSSIDGSIYRLDTGYSADGAPLNSYFETGDLTSGGFMITIQEILIEVQRLGSYSLSVGTSIDRGVTWTEKTVDLTVTGAASYFKRLNLNIMGDCIRLRVRIDATDQPFEVHRLTAFYMLSKARGSLN